MHNAVRIISQKRIKLNTTHEKKVLSFTFAFGKRHFADRNKALTTLH